MRELENLIGRVGIRASDGVLPNPLPVPMLQPVLGSTVPQIRGESEPAVQKTLRDSEREFIIQTLDTVGWVIGGLTGAAAKLGLQRTTLIHRMKKLGIERPTADC